MVVKFVHGPERTRELPVTADTPSGSPVVVGAFVGIALTKEGSGVGNRDGYATVGLGGVTKQPVGTTTAAAVGVAIYITSAYALTPASSGNTLFGHALTAKGTTAGEEIEIELHQV